LRNVQGEIVGLTGAAVDITQRKEGEAHLRMLMREITHRSKNLLAVIQAMARQTARHAGSIETFLEQFGARLQALATSHDLLVSESWHGASLHDLVRLQLGPYLEREGSRISFEGPRIILKPEAAQSLGLALYELVSNASRHGALATPKGQVSITWRRQPAAEGAGVELMWKETAEQKIGPPGRRGFGTLVIERHLAKSLDAEVELSFPESGATCRVQVPLVQFVAPLDAANLRPSEPESPSAR
jgi:two-component sensor histidine kinase